MRVLGDLCQETGRRGTNMYFLLSHSAVEKMLSNWEFIIICIHWFVRHLLFENKVEDLETSFQGYTTSEHYSWPATGVFVPQLFAPLCAVPLQTAQEVQNSRATSRDQLLCGKDSLHCYPHIEFQFRVKKRLGRNSELENKCKDFQTSSVTLSLIYWEKPRRSNDTPTLHSSWQESDILFSFSSIVPPTKHFTGQ